MAKVVITRVFDAPRERVWQAWTDPEQIKKWWGPKNFTAPVIEIDFKVGGKYLFCMRGVPAPGQPEMDLYSTGEFKEIVPMEKIVWTDEFSDAEGNIQPASYYGMPGDEPVHMLVTTTFEDSGDGKTKLTITHEGGMADMPDESKNMEQGWNESLDKLAAAVKEN